MEYKIEIPQHDIVSYTKDIDIETLQEAIIECFKSKTEIDVYDKGGEKVAAVWQDASQEKEWNYFC